jgi:hypothetical protein
MDQFLKGREPSTSRDEDNKKKNRKYNESYLKY